MKEPEIIFENNDFLVINKPVGLVVHPDGKNNTKTLVDWILEKYPEIKEVGEPLVIQDQKILRPGIVHRLDKDTSGVMLIAKTEESFQNLKKQFQDRTVRKCYHSFVYGNLREDLFLIDKPIGRSSGDIRKWSSMRDARGQMREAKTLIRVLGRGKYQNEIFTYLEAEPKTGRTHQIRVHLRAIDKPIVCDSLYAPKRECILDFKRLALHAREISFLDLNGVLQTFVADFPDDFKNAIAQL